MMGGREVVGTTRDARERRLLNVVEEMAIAAGVPVPPVYVLPDEAGINAFAAGHAPGDAVVAVSRGSLTYLTRDELQGVVAHEFSHILNGDMRLNLRIIGLIFGIIALSQIGWVLMQAGRGSRSSKDGAGNIVLLGVGLYVLGLGGAFFGWLIQAAVSRQREYLADASAVQFTRNPDGIGGALKKIGGLKDGSRINDAHAGEVSHLFLADAFFGRRSTDLFATHPPLADRIKCLDPQFDGTYPDVRPVAVDPEERKGPRAGQLPRIIPGVPPVALPVLVAAAQAAPDSVGHVEPQHVTYAAAMHTSIPAPLRDAAQAPFSARAVIYALLLDPRPDIRQAQLARLQAQAEPRDYEETVRLAEAIRQLPDAAHLPLADLAIPALRQMSPRQHQVFRAQVTALIHADERVSLFEYCLHCVVAAHLDADFHRRRPQVRYRSLAQVLPQVATVLSLLAWEGQPDPDAAREAFAAGLKAVDPAARAALRDRPALPEFDAALRGLATALPAIKRQVLAGCAACIVADRQVTVREGELLRAISATLDCPMPPLTDRAGHLPEAQPPVPAPA
jgi:Zn-dependent protease with chaperone function